jgi:hypothetical protein
MFGEWAMLKLEEDRMYKIKAYRYSRCDIRFRWIDNMLMGFLCNLNTDDNDTKILLGVVGINEILNYSVDDLI